MEHKWPVLLIASLKQFLLYDPNAEDKAVLRIDNGPFYGLSWSKNYLFLGVRYGTGGGSKVHIYDRDFQDIGKLPSSFDQHHQIFYLDKKLYITNTGNNSVAIWDGQNVTQRDWTYQERKKYNKHDHDRDMHHINSLWAPSQDSKEIWVGCHNMTYYSKRPSEIKVMNLDLTKVLRSYTVGESLHNVFVDGKKLYICNSGKEEFLQYDMPSRQVNRTLPIGKWTRGLAATPEYFVVGSSQMGIGLEREQGNLTLSLIHRPSWKIVDRRNLNGNGAVFELRIVDQMDLAHNGIECPLNWKDML